MIIVPFARLIDPRRIAWDVVAVWATALMLSLAVDYAVYCGIRRLVAYAS